MNAATNHPNRDRAKGRNNPCATPSADEIRALRVALGMTQEVAAELVCYSARGWKHLEAGERRMHPAAWQLFLLKTAHLPRKTPGVDVPAQAPVQAESPAPDAAPPP
jgi:DNA-binding transcriptional regulator YiaG